MTLKRVFDLQISKIEWKLLWFKLNGHTRSYSKNDTKKLFKFELGKTTVFPLGNKWKGLDWVKADIFEIKNKGYWEDFLSFLEKYFSIHYKESIPLGRYGLAVLIKNSGPENLKILTTTQT